MSLITAIKLNSLSTLHEARYGAGMMVDYLGYSVGNDDPQRILPEVYAEITGWVEGPENVIENPVDLAMARLYLMPS